MRWKNGAGQTSEIAIHPPEAQFSNGDFDWRISSAQVEQDSDFSIFPGCNRLLVLIGKNAVDLNGKRVLPWVPVQFAGETMISCQVINEGTLDLGVIFQRDRFVASMTVNQLPTGAKGKLHPANSPETRRFLFCARGHLIFSNFKLGTFDTLCPQGNFYEEFTCEQDSTFIQISIEPRSAPIT